MALYGLVEGSSWQSAIIWMVAGLPTLLVTVLLAFLCLLQGWKPMGAAFLCLIVGLLVMPAGTIAQLLMTCFFAKECV